MTTFTWDGAEDIWESDHWGRASVAPKWPGDSGSTENDEVYLAGGMAPTTGPAASLTVKVFNTSALEPADLNPAITAGISIKSGGTLSLHQSHFWSGSTAAVGTFGFNQSSMNVGTVGDSAAFNDASTNHGTAGDFALFYGCNGDGGTVGDFALFYGGYNSDGGTVGDFATFSGGYNWGTVGDFATFNDSSSNAHAGTVGSFATFNDASYCEHIATVADGYVINSTDFINHPAYVGRTAPLPLEADVRSGITFGQEQVGALEVGVPPMLVV